MRAFLSTCLPSPNLLTFHVFGLFLQEGHMLDFSRSYLFSLTSFKKTGSRHMRKKKKTTQFCVRLERISARVLVASMARKEFIFFVSNVTSLRSVATTISRYYAGDHSCVPIRS